MRILFLSTENPYPPDSGHRLRTYNILKCVASEHEIYYLGFIKKKEDMRCLDHVKKMCRDAEFVLIPDDASRVRTYLSLLRNLISPLPYVAQKYYVGAMREKIRDAVRTKAIDIVHFDMLHLSRYNKDTGDIGGVLVEHNVESTRLLSLAKRQFNPIAKTFFYYQFVKLRRFERDECGKFSCCVAVSEDDRKELNRLCPGARIEVVPNGVDTDYFAPGDGGDVQDHSAVWVGGMKDMYNRQAVEYFCDEIFPRVLDRLPDAKFVAVGGDPPKSLLALSRQNGNVTVTGYVDDVRPIVHRAHVFVAPIRSGGGTKLKVLNALAMGKPVVTTTVGAEGLDVIDGEHLLIANDAETFARGIVEVMCDPALAQRLGRNGRELVVRKYDWKKIGAKMSEIYRIVSEGSPRARKDGGTRRASVHGLLAESRSGQSASTGS